MSEIIELNMITFQSSICFKKGLDSKEVFMKKDIKHKN